jgi:hypothetical protein
MHLTGTHTNNGVSVALTPTEFNERIDKLQYRFESLEPDPDTNTIINTSYNNFYVSDGAISTAKIIIPKHTKLELLKTTTYRKSLNIDSKKYISFNFTTNTDNIEPCLLLGGNIQSLKGYDNTSRKYDFYRLFENCTLIKRI